VGLTIISFSLYVLYLYSIENETLFYLESFIGSTTQD